MYTVVVSLSHILPKCAKPREPEYEHCVLQYTHKGYYICDPIPLDTPKNHTLLPCITKGRFHLYSDTSKFVNGSALYQIQNGKSKLIAYASKRLSDAL